jgi:hypothetical protein
MYRWRILQVGRKVAVLYIYTCILSLMYDYMSINALALDSYSALDSCRRPDPWLVLLIFILKIVVLRNYG